MTAKLESGERRKLLIEILKNPPRKPVTGQVDWEKMFADDAELKAKLGGETVEGRKRLSVMVANLRTKGLVPFSPDYKKAKKNGKKRIAMPPAQTAAAPAPAPAPAPEPPPTAATLPDDKQREDLIRGILHNYATKKGTPWKKVFKKHPEYKALLGIVDKLTMQRVYYRATQLLKKDPEFEHLHFDKSRKAEPAPEPAATAMACTITGPNFEMKFSPKLLPTILHTLAIAMDEK